MRIMSKISTSCLPRRGATARPRCASFAQAQSRCRKLTVIVPDQAKSAGTMFVLGADRVYMGPTSDLGPVDPQFPLPGRVACRSAGHYRGRRRGGRTNSTTPDYLRSSRLVALRHHSPNGTAGPRCDGQNG